MTERFKTLKKIKLAVKTNNYVTVSVRRWQIIHLVCIRSYYNGQSTTLVHGFFTREHISNRSYLILTGQPLAEQWYPSSHIDVVSSLKQRRLSTLRRLWNMCDFVIELKSDFNVETTSVLKKMLKNIF